MDSMRTNDISQWENVYLSNKNTFASCNKRNLEVYRCIREEEYETLEKCAEYWIENRSHAAFVHFFIEKGMFPNELFVDCLNGYVKIFKEKYNCKKISWTTLRVMKKEYWLSLDIGSDKLMDKVYCYKNGYIKKLCTKKDIQEIKYQIKMAQKTQKEKEKEAKTNGKKQKIKTIENYSVPDREIMIQLGIYFNLSSADVDKLLCMARLPQFYVPDIVDAVSMYYLDRYHEEGIKNPNMWKEEGENRIIETKEGINRVLHIMLDDIETGSQKHENLKSKMYTVEVNKGKIPPYRKIVYQHSLCDTVDEEIKKFMEEVEPEKNREILNGNTLYITTKMKNLYEEHKKDDFKTLIDQVILQKSKDSKYVSAIEYRYGYMRRLQKAMRDAIMKNGCEKNFENINWTFGSKQPWKYEFLKKNLSEDVQTQSDKKEEKRLSGKKKKPEEKIRRKKEDIVHIWYCEDFIEQGPESESKSTVGASYSLDYYIRNRPLKVETTKTKEDGSRETVKESIKIPQMMSKTALTKFTIATGSENKRDMYFEAVGYGVEREWYPEYVNDLKDEAEDKMRTKTRDNSYPVDRGDMLFEYVCILRDKLIKKYVENDKEKNPDIFGGNLKKSFPFARMMNYVTRDIQYVLEFIAGRDLSRQINENEKEFKKKKEILQKEDELVVQKDRLQNIGNSGYCLCFPYSVKECEWYYAGGEK